VTLLATAPGILDYAWQMEGDYGLRFSAALGEVTEAPGGSVLIVPELSTGSLFGLGVLAMANGRRRARADRMPLRVMFDQGGESCRCTYRPAPSSSVWAGFRAWWVGSGRSAAVSSCS